MKKIYTIGHSTRKLNNFIKILIENRIHCLVDVRSYPGSRMVPQFNKETLKKKLAKYGIKYYHLPNLGGRRKNKTTIHTSLIAQTFASYAEYMMHEQFKEGLIKLKKIARSCKTAFMCAEGPWWRCHRRMIADRLEYDGWEVYHLGIRKEPVRHIVWNVSRFDENGNVIYDQ